MNQCMNDHLHPEKEEASETVKNTPIEEYDILLTEGKVERLCLYCRIVKAEKMEHCLSCDR